jgi:hypothetical protein
MNLSHGASLYDAPVHWLFFGRHSLHVHSAGLFPRAIRSRFHNTVTDGIFRVGRKRPSSDSARTDFLVRASDAKHETLVWQRPTQTRLWNTQAIPERPKPCHVSCPFWRPVIRPSTLPLRPRFGGPGAPFSRDLGPFFLRPWVIFFWFSGAEKWGHFPAPPTDDP